MRSDFVNHVTDKPYVVIVIDSDTGKKREMGFDTEEQANRFKLAAEEDGSYYGIHTNNLSEKRNTMKKSELKALVREVVENMYARHNPDNPTGGPSHVPGHWANQAKVDELKKRLDQALEAGNFDIAHEIVDQFKHYTN